MRGEVATAEALVSLLEGFASTPQETRQVLRDWLEMDPAGFRESALAYLRDFRPVAGSGFCFHLLAARGLLDELVWEASRKSSRTLPALLTHLKSTDPDFSVRAAQSIAMRLQRDPGGCTDDLKLLMRILGATEPEPRLLPYLTRLTKASDATVASKAALLAGKLIQSGDWFVDRLLDSDPRVRANAVEALWGLDHEAAVDLFRRAARDPAGRVAANAWYGLYQAGRVESMSGLVRMAAEDDASRQASAAWAWARPAIPGLSPPCADCWDRRVRSWSSTRWPRCAPSPQRSRARTPRGRRSVSGKTSGTRSRRSGRSFCPPARTPVPSIGGWRAPRE
jgi:HEAT repeat protein